MREDESLVPTISWFSLLLKYFNKNLNCSEKGGIVFVYLILLSVRPNKYSKEQLKKSQSFNAVFSDGALLAAKYLWIEFLCADISFASSAVVIFFSVMKFIKAFAKVRQIKKTVYILKYLNDSAEEKGINFSKVLREALAQELNENI